MPVDPWAIDTLTFSGLEARNADAMLVMSDGTALGSRSGVRPGDPGLTVTLAGTTINCSAGVAAVAYAGQGIYRVAFPSSVSPGTYTAAHATLNRIDLVYLRVWDTSVDASGLNKADIVYLAGTPSGSPVAPTPAGTQIYVPLATITVLSVSNGGTASVSTAVRPNTVSPGGILPAATAPSNPYVGQYYDDGTGLLRWNGTTWRQINPYAPVTSPQTSQPASFTAGSFTDFAGANWTPITFTVPPSGRVWVSIGGAVQNTQSGSATGWIAWRASGGVTEAASELNGLSTWGSRNYGTRRVLRSWTPGASVTITPQYNFSAVGAIGAVTRASDGLLAVEPVAATT
ncbi:hypothetical protein [Streptomyces graminilatus]|uniref:hypothetical protein n=1 Tax=Streptomyces graminilatus TaxID=1464070 RepID=UPI0006E13453|nr:hypothetical protein [Streptomyces graminilatus]